MGLINCKDKRHTCGVPFPSTCVSFEGEFNGVLKKDEFSCDVNLNDIIYKLSAVSKELETKVDGLTGRVTFTEGEVKVIKAEIQGIIDNINNLDPNEIFVTIDLDCLSSDAAPCKVGTNKYSLLSLLKLFVSEICLLKA